MKYLEKFIHIVDSINEWAGQITIYFIIALMLLVVGEVGLRYFFSHPTIWAFEVSEGFLLVIFCLGGGYTLLHDGHVRIDILYTKWSSKTRAILDIFSYLFVFLLCIVLIWYGGLIAWEALIEGRPSESAWAPPVWPTWIMVPIGGLLLGLQCLAKWTRDLILVLAGIKLGSKAEATVKKQHI